MSYITQLTDVNTQDVYPITVDSAILDESGNTLSTRLEYVAYYSPSGETTTLPSFDPYTDTVWNKQQTLTDAQKTQARANLGFGNGGIDTYPVSGSTNPITSSAVWDYTNCFDVSAHNNSATYTLAEAIAAVPQTYRRAGIKLSFISGDTNKYEEWYLTASA